MYTILIADPNLYSVGMFMTKEHAEKYKTDNELSSDALVIEIKINLNKQRGTEVPTKLRNEKLLERLIHSKDEIKKELEKKLSFEFKAMLEGHLIGINESIKLIEYYSFKS